MHPLLHCFSLDILDIKIVALNFANPLLLLVIEALLPQKMAKIVVVSLHSKPVAH